MRISVKHFISLILPLGIKKMKSSFHDVIAVKVYNGGADCSCLIIIYLHL